ncbi:MAG: DUF2938 family protein [Cytophagaceae bacterium]|nr:DUF2938 family protein [Gemmatimonadaceae bacterium]
MFSLLLVAVIVGIGATAGIDAWNAMLKRVFGVGSLDYCLLGRWLGSVPRGVLRHRSITEVTPLRLECILGWMAHYAIGTGLAMAFVMAVPGWLARPTLTPALVYGVATVAFPFFILQPALGLGVASSATRRPALARVKSLATHGIYGLGLYVWAWIVTRVVHS